MSDTTDLKVIESTQLNVFGSYTDFASAWKIAGALASSTIIPASYQKNPSNCLIALEMATRMKLSPMMVMQNLHIIQGRPSWGATVITGLINGSRRYKGPLQYEVSGKGESLSCYCWAIDQEDRRIEGPTVTMEMAKKEGWLDKTDARGNKISKWLTMPEVMIRYRAASFFGRIHCSDLILGLYSTEEVEEMEPDAPVQYATVDAEINANANSESIDIPNNHPETAGNANPEPEQTASDSAEPSEPQQIPPFA